MKTLLTSLGVAPPVSSPVKEARSITVAVLRTKSSADSNSTWELWALGGSLMVATLPSGRPVLKLKTDGRMRSLRDSRAGTNRCGLGCLRADRDGGRDFFRKRCNQDSAMR